MRRHRSMATTVLLACALGVSPTVSAQEASSRPVGAQTPDGGDVLRSSEARADAMDPVMRAILFAMAAKVLREAAASPDPLAALGDTIERSIASAATNPQTLRTIEALTAQALKDAPPELRQALLAFIVSTLKQVRREVGQPRSELR